MYATSPHAASQLKQVVGTSMYRFSTFFGHDADSYSTQSSHSAMGGKDSRGVTFMAGGSRIQAPQDNGGNCPARTYAHSYRHKPTSTGTNAMSGTKCPVASPAKMIKRPPLQALIGPKRRVPKNAAACFAFVVSCLPNRSMNAAIAKTRK